MFIAFATLVLAATFAFLVHRRTAVSDSSRFEKKHRRNHDAISSPLAASHSQEPEPDSPPAATMSTITESEVESQYTSEEDGTPKAVPADHNTASIPTLELDASHQTNSMPPPPPPLTTRPPTLGLMPPPRGPVPRMNPAAGLRIPSTGPLPNRRPSPNQPHKVSTASTLSPGLSANTAGQRNKVELTPGHSPLDWATLCRSSNLSGVTGLQRVTPSQLAFHHGRKGRDAWSSFRGKVYNISPYLLFHPGGKGELMRAAGKDGEKLFMEVHSWVNWENMMASCLVGIMVSEEAGQGLDEMD